MDELKFKYKNPDEGFKTGSLCYHKGSFAKVIDTENNCATIVKCMVHNKEDLFFFTSSDEEDVYEPIKVFPNEYEIVLEPNG